MSYSAIRSATASARSTVSNAYCASTISVISGPAAARTSRATSTTQSSGPDRPLCAYGPENVASSLAAVKPRSRARVAQPTIDSTYASNDDTSGCSDAYGVSVSPRASPHSCQHGTPSALPAQVPQRDVDRADRVHQRAPAPGHAGADVQLLPDRLDVGRVAADQQRPQPPVHRVRARRLDARAGDPRVQIGLADPGQALVGLDLDDDRVLRRAGRPHVVAGVEQHVRADVGDAHRRQTRL